MNPPGTGASLTVPGIPRVSGDEPLHTDSANFFKKYSPRERG